MTDGGYIITVFAILIVIAAGLLGAPLLKARTGTEAFDAVKHAAVVAVSAAEQLFKGTGRGAEKLIYAMELVRAITDWKGGDETIRAVVEAQVRNMNA